MNALFWLMGLILVVLFLLVLSKPISKSNTHQQRPFSYEPDSKLSPQLQTLLGRLTTQLPEFVLIVKTR